jgi:ankyrin repeat protein
LLKGRTPLHWAAEKGNTDVAKVLLEAGASLSAMDNMVIKHSEKLRQSNIKLFK